jgi:hypothetical protein
MSNGKLNSKRLVFLLAVIVCAIGLYLRSAGLFRGLQTGPSYHPDEAKQIVALSNYLDGKYVWYVGSLFYDGYPYGLNHIDEWILRPIFFIKDAIAHHLDPSAAMEEPSVHDLYYWVRALRVLYGMLVLLVAWLISRKLFRSPYGTLFVLLVLAVSPLLITTSHFGTGDIGVDLFTALMLYMLCLHHERYQARYIFLAGLFLGVAFGCKYQGLLGGIAVAVYIAGHAISLRSLRRFAAYALSSLLGCITGAVLVTPAFFINGKRTWRDIRANFSFIRNYGLSPDFLEKPLIEKALFGFNENLPTIIHALGWSLFIAACAGLVACVITQILKSRRQVRDDSSKRLFPLAVAVFIYPFLALLVSVAGKPALQVFHFSYLQLPLALCALNVLVLLWRYRCLAARAFAVILAAIIVGELACAADRENFFWSREDTVNLYGRFPSEYFTEKALKNKEGTIKSFVLEFGNAPAVFRNRPIDIGGPHAALWNRFHILPIPTIPAPIGSDWIFMNGPVFPRNDRMLQIEGNDAASRVLVYENRPQQIYLGIRSCEWPTRLSGHIGGQPFSVSLPANSQRLLSLVPKRIKTLSSGLSKLGDLYLIKTDVVTELGGATVTYMADQRAVENFTLFGAVPPENDNVHIPGADEFRVMEPMFDGTAYHEESYGKGIDLDSNDSESGRKTLVPVSAIPLPAGIYLFEIDVLSRDKAGLLEIRQHDPLGLNECAADAQAYALEKGTNRICFVLKKTFAPYRSQIEVNALRGRVVLRSIEIKPDFVGIRNDILAWKEHDKRPEWFGVGVPASASEGKSLDMPGPILVDGAIEFSQIRTPVEVNGGDELVMECPIAITDFRIRNVDELSIFIHFVDKNQRQVLALENSVAMAAAAAAQGRALSFGKIDLPPGEYALKMGVYNHRTEKRLKITSISMDNRADADRRIHLGSLTVKD